VCCAQCAVRSAESSVTSPAWPLTRGSLLDSARDTEQRHHLPRRCRQTAALRSFPSQEPQTHPAPTGARCTPPPKSMSRATNTLSPVAARSSTARRAQHSPPPTLAPHVPAPPLQDPELPLPAPFRPTHRRTEGRSSWYSLLSSSPPCLLARHLPRRAAVAPRARGRAVYQGAGVGPLGWWALLGSTD